MVFFKLRGNVWGFSSSYDGELSENLVWLQGSPVSIRVARGSLALLWIHCRGIRPQDALKGEFRGPFRVAAGNPGFTRIVMLTSWSFLLFLLEARNTVDLGGASRNPLGLVQWKTTSSRVEAGTSGFLSCSDVGLGLCMPFQTGR